MTITQRRLALGVIAGACLLNGQAALAKTTDSIDLQAGLGFSSNPLLQLDGRSSAFGRISANAVHSWESERGRTTLSGYLEDTIYVKDYGSRQIFSLAGHTSQTVSPTVTVFGDFGFSGDFAGQLSNRLVAAPTEPVVTDPGNPLPPVSATPDVFGFAGRQYRLNGSVGASIRSGPRGTISLSAGAQRSWFTGSGNSDADFNSYFASAGYSRQISERTAAGASINLQRQDFTHGNWANIVNPVLTLSTHLSETISANGAVGVLAIQQRSAAGTDHSVSPSFSGSLCREGEISQWCVRVSRDARSALSARVANASGGVAAVTTLASVDYYRKFSENSTLQVSLSGTRYSSSGTLNGDAVHSTYLSAVTGYDHKIGQRIYAGISGGARKLFQDGPDPKTDFNASVYLRYRLGNLQ